MLINISKPSKATPNIINSGLSYQLLFQSLYYTFHPDLNYLFNRIMLIQHDSVDVPVLTVFYLFRHPCYVSIKIHGILFLNKINSFIDWEYCYRYYYAHIISALFVFHNVHIHRIYICFQIIVLLQNKNPQFPFSFVQIKLWYDNTLCFKYSKHTDVYCVTDINCNVKNYFFTEIIYRGSFLNESCV